MVALVVDVGVHPGGGDERGGGRGGGGVVVVGEGVVDRRRAVGGGGVAEEVLRVLRVVLGQHAIDDEFRAHCSAAW